MRRFYAVSVCRLWAYWLWFRHLGTIGLGSQVTFSGKRYSVINGNLVGLWTLIDDNKKLQLAPREEVKRVRTWAEFFHGATNMHRWYMTNWYRIDVLKLTSPELWKDQATGTTYGRCTKCRRREYDTTRIGKLCEMPQPNRVPCIGVIKSDR